MADPCVFQTSDPAAWELVYQNTMDKKYAKGGRNFSRSVGGTPYEGEGSAPIFLIPRERGGPSYKSVPLEGASSDAVVYCLISKGFGMQDVSSFTLGPIVGEGLCLVNAAFSKAICLMHIVGGGVVDLKRKNYWRPKRVPDRVIKVIDDHHLMVDGVLYRTGSHGYEVMKLCGYPSGTSGVGV